MRHIYNIPVYLAPGFGAKVALSHALRNDVDQSLDLFTINVFEIANEERTVAMFSAESVSGSQGNTIRRFYSGRAYLRCRFCSDGTVSTAMDAEYDEVMP